jgi:CheY-like chemotaxis protein
MAATILVCDNEAPLRALVHGTFDQERFTIVEARDGDESLERARSAEPDLVLLDVMMPGRSGLEVLRELRSDPKLAQTPVVMLTARAQAADLEAAEAAGADRFLTKPFSPAQLAELVEDLLGGRPRAPNQQLG